MKRKLVGLFILFSLVISPFMVRSQVVTTSPQFPTDKDSCTVFYNAALGNGALKDVSPPIYAHTGVITDQSTSPTDWKYVIAGWSENTNKAKLTPLGNNQYKLQVTPSIRAFYGVPEGEKILKLAFVFRNSDGSIVGRDTDGSDIYADVYTDSLSVNIVSPENRELYLKEGDMITLQVVSPLADSLTLFIDNVQEIKVSGTTLNYMFSAQSLGHNWVKHWVKVRANNASSSVFDSLFYVIIPEATTAQLPDNIQPGINYIDSTSVILALFAPEKNNAFIIGDFNNWEPDSASYMYQTPDLKYFWKQVSNLEANKEYLFQYLVDGTIKVADPYCDKICDPDDQYISENTYPGLLPYPLGKTTGIASYLQTAQMPYPWLENLFISPAKTDLVIYELLIRDFLADHSYPSLIDTLDYLKRLGINAIELMPVMEFEGNSSWGYNPDFMFAPDKYYGTKNQLKQFIEAAHQKGIAVIFDIVLNHQFGKSPLVQLYWDGSSSQPASNSPWFNQVPKHPYNVGFDFNHESVSTREFSKRVMKYWLEEYHIDGYRFDLSKGFTQKNSYPDNVALWGQYDASRIAIWKEYNSYIQSIKPGAYVILEHFADNSEEKVLAAEGMMLWGNMNYSYIQASMGFTTGSDFSWISYQKRGWAEPNVVGYMESHDEERMAYKNLTFGNSTNPEYNIKDSVTSMDRIQMAALFFLTVPGPKMLWEFEELAYQYSIEYGGRLAPKPIRWDYYTDWHRKYLYNVFAALIDLKKSQPLFETTNFTMEVGGSMKKIYLTSDQGNGVVVGNFGTTEGATILSFPSTGYWYDYFSGDSILVATNDKEVTLQHGEYHLYTSYRLQKPLFTGLNDNAQGSNKTSSWATIYPNPTSQTATIQVTVDHQTKIQINIFDLSGRLIRTFAEKQLGRGTHTEQWNLTNLSGNRVPSGVYMCRIQLDNKVEVGKMIVE